MDVTNAVRYWDEWDVIFPVMQKMKAEGNKVPQFCFWAFNGPVITVVQDLYDRIYKTNKYKDLWFYWDGEADPTGFELMNGMVLDKKLMINKTGELFYRIRADMHHRPDLSDYPRDSQSISIDIEDGVHTKEDLVYLPDTGESGIGEDLDVLGWEIEDSRVSVTDSHYSNWGETYSRYTHRLVIARPGTAVLGIIIPIIFIAITAWLCFFLPLHKLGEKMALGGTALLSAVALHIYITATTPPLGYLTLADKYVIALYAFLVAILAGMVIVEKHVGRKDTPRARRFNETFAAVSLIAPVIMFLVLLLF